MLKFSIIYQSFNQLHFNIYTFFIQMFCISIFIRTFATERFTNKQSQFIIHYTHKMRKSFKKGERIFYERFPSCHKCDSILTLALCELLDIHTYQSIRNAIEKGVGITTAKKEKVAELFRSIGINEPWDE